VIGGLQANMNGYTSQLGGGWQGNAAVAFTRTYEMFSADFAKVLNALQVIHEKLVSTRNTYQATEDANTSRVNQVAGLIGGGAATGLAAGKGAALGGIGVSGTGVKGGVDIGANAPASTGMGDGATGGGLGQIAASLSAAKGAAA
jgi:WXG100 family type VII secretion target